MKLVEAALSHLIDVTRTIDIPVFVQLKAVLSAPEESPLSILLGNLENHVHAILLLKLGTIDGLGITDDSNDGPIGTS